MDKGPGATLRSKPTDKGTAAVYSDVFIYGGCQVQLCQLFLSMVQNFVRFSNAFKLCAAKATSNLYQLYG